MLKATWDNVIVEVLYKDKVHEASRIFIPEEAKKRHAGFRGKVVSVGPDDKYGLKGGERVIFSRGEGKPIYHEDKEYMMLKPERIMGVEDV